MYIYFIWVHLAVVGNYIRGLGLGLAVLAVLRGPHGVGKWTPSCKACFEFVKLSLLKQHCAACNTRSRAELKIICSNCFLIRISNMTSSQNIFVKKSGKKESCLGDCQLVNLCSLDQSWLVTLRVAPSLWCSGPSGFHLAVVLPMGVSPEPWPSVTYMLLVEPPLPPGAFLI